MKHWIETHDYFQQQLKLQKDYKQNCNQYIQWLQTQKLKVIQQEKERK